MSQTAPIPSNDHEDSQPTAAPDRLLPEAPPPRRRSRAVIATAAAATLALVFGVAGGIAVGRTSGPAALTDAAAASLAATVYPTGCSTAEVDVTPGAPAPIEQPIGPTVVQFPHDAEPARPHLQNLHSLVTASPPDRPGCGRYVFVRLRQWAADTTVGPDGIGTTTTMRFEHYRWRADDRSGRVVTHRQAVPEPTITSEDFTTGELPGAIRAPLSTDPAALAGQINDVQPWRMGDQAGIRATADIYGWHEPDRDQRAAILAVLYERNLRWRGDAVDRAGRPGVAVSVDSSNGATRDLLILDPATGRPLAYELVFLRNPGSMRGPFPAVQDYVLYLHHNRQPNLT
ncbi:hypothetical protein [Phytohabitans aurantiacus]|uniref:CU044_5270 family protein n=1 Tax=Phytohabitans aurantiacus TaxID=3016789 RepID=A0ABQ5R1Z1_9ACTN|nr:hypothetical protein [Phytohabitans aurantiacus]GLH99876.1 hypothetical protein Pa4123_51520 [Phytohabitans aurantiacus]